MRIFNTSRCVLCVVAASLLALSAYQAQAKSKTRIYTVKRGDTCWNIAARHYNDPKKYLLIHRFNALGPLPHILTPGQQLILPINTNVPDATLAWLRREVKAKSPTGIDWFHARARMNLWQLYKVTTGNESTAGIKFEDASQMKMRPGTLVVIFGGTGARKFKTERLKKRSIIIEKGVIHGGLAGLYKNASLKVKTPSSEIEIKSTKTQVEVTKDKTSIVSVHDGHTLVKAQKKTVRVEQNMGTIVTLGKAPSKPIPLPKPPRWLKDMRQIAVFAPVGHSGEFVAGWDRVRRATRYRVEFANNRQFTNPIVDAVVGRGVMQLRVKELKPGEYFARVYAVGRRRLTSRASKLLRVRVFPLVTSRLLRKIGPRSYESAGLLRIQPPNVQAAVSISSDKFVRFDQALRFRGPQNLSLSFRLPDGNAGVTTFNITLLDVTGSIEAGKRPLMVRGNGRVVHVRVADSKGRATSLPGFKLVAYPGGVMQTKLVGPGHYTATVLAPMRYDLQKITLRSSWIGGDLASATLTVVDAPKPKAAQERPFGWDNGPIHASWGVVGPRLLMKSARPMAFVGLSTTMTNFRRPGFTRELAFGLAFRGELTFLNERLAVDMDLPWFNVPTKQDSINQQKLGDTYIGIRYLALKTRSLALTPQLAATFGTAQFQRSQREHFFEPGVLFEWRYKHLLTLHTNQTIMIGFRSGNSDVFGMYAAGYAVTYRPVKLFSIGLTFNTMIGIFGPRNETGIIALYGGGGVRFHIGRVRIGVVTQSALNKDGRDLLGDFTVGVNVDLGFLGW